MMRLDHTPPAGAGKAQGVKKTDLLLRHIESLGTDKVSGNPIGIRVAALAEATGVGVTSIPTLLQPYVLSGRLQCCKITRPGLPPMNEYRRGVGVPTDFKPLNAKRAGIALRGTPKPASTGTTPLSTPKPDVSSIATPQLLKKPPQPEVGKADATPAAGNSSTPRAAPAVAAKATPGPAAGTALKKEPATQRASAGDVRIGINDSGTLVIALDGDSIELNPKQARRLGHFMAGTQGVWNPF